MELGTIPAETSILAEENRECQNMAIVRIQVICFSQ